MNSLSSILHKAKQFLDGSPNNQLAEFAVPAISAYDCQDPADVLAIDVSPSMEESDYPPSRLEGAKQAGTRFLVRRAERDPQALVGVVAFSDSGRLVAPLLPVGENLSRLRHAVERLSTSPTTNIAAGLRVARREFARSPNARGRRVLLLTDGHSNCGADPVEEANTLKASGIQLDIIGIGGSPEEVNEPELKQMASVVNGELRYWFIRSVGELVRKFETLALREIK